MARGNLEILRGPYRAALLRGLEVESCRLLTDLSVRCDRGWTPFRPAIIDTGAPLSLFPRRVWQRADVPRPDERDSADRGPALLAETDNVQTLLGMCGVLTELILHANVSGNEAYVERTQ